MKNIQALIGFIAFLFIVPCLLFAGNPASSLFVTYEMNCVWRVHTDGKIEKLTCMDGRYVYTGSISAGSNSPSVSPDRKYVAFIRKDDLWLYRVDTKDLMQITRAGKSETKTYASVDVSIITWSWDSKKILYAIYPGEGIDPEGHRPDKKIRPVKYGLYVYNVGNASSELVAKKIEGSISAWLPDGKMLVENEKKRLSTVEPGSKPTPFPVTGELSQITVSPDGKWIAALTSSPDRLVKVNLTNYEVVPLTPAGEFAEYQWPKISPSGKHVLYERRSGMKDGIPILEVTVDGKKLYTSSGLSDYSWVDDRVIAFTQRTSDNGLEIMVIDSATGKTVGRHKVKTGKPSR